MISEYHDRSNSGTGTHSDLSDTDPPDGKDPMGMECDVLDNPNAPQEIKDKLEQRCRLIRYSKGPLIQNGA